ncbi:MAG: glycine zipper family protein [Bdellovibrionales bacterium]|nr:glycine zipper domain-containing protein [Bdellovibrionales bacterium]NQZ18923.1 glycine zipper family protein [Bdellovibrionales bacterium]
MSKSLYIILSLSLLTGCATTTESMMTGAAIGTATGTVLGHQQSGNGKGRMKGAVLGATFGTIFGYLAHKDKQKRKGMKRKKPPKPLFKRKGFNPFLTKPKVRMYWVPHKIEGNRFIERHRIWEIESNSTWAN